MASPAVEFLLNLFFPQSCALCRGQLPDYNSKLCESCRKGIYPMVEGEEPFSRLIYVGLYEGRLRESLRRFKFESMQSYGAAYAGLLADAYKRFGGEPPDLVTWVPVSRKRLNRRGYDQCMLIAQPLCRLMGWERPYRVLKRVKTPPPQYDVPPEERAENIEGSYVCVKPERVAGKRILLIDDIYTTGATMEACTGLIRDAGAAGVVRMCVARSRYSGNKTGKKAE